MEGINVDAMLQREGYRRIGGMASRVYVHDGRGEILKLAVMDDPDWREYKYTDFQNAWKASQEYAPLGLMPEVLKAGKRYGGTSYPYLRERYVRGENMNRAYLREPALWKGHLAGELRKIYIRIRTTQAYPIEQVWQDKLVGLEEFVPVGLEEVHTRVKQAGVWLAEHVTTGYRIHGDLQFGNMLAVEREGQPSLLLIDWEMSEVMSLAYEFAMLYTFLHDPLLQVEPELREPYGKIAPLDEVWQAVLLMLHEDLGIMWEEIRQTIVFRMGLSWLGWMQRYKEGGEREAYQYWERKLVELVEKLST